MLPQAFCTRMKRLLGDEADDLFRELEKPDAVHGLRVNTAKISKEKFLSLFPYTCREIPYAADGFLVDADKLGNTPYHHAGMMYLQDPGAMSTLHALSVRQGWRILDACAAPGGKSSQASAYTGDGGLVVSNEFVPARARVLAGNLERLGCRNTLVTNVDTAVLGDWYPGCFDLVIADVPCSGEGMFRKNAEAIAEWSPENVALCVGRQREILSNIAGCVRQGGYLLYSTCTFSTEENEENVSWFLHEHPDFRIVPAERPLHDCTADGILLSGCPAELALTRRFYPHRCPGEGQYIALLQRDGDRAPESPRFRENLIPLTREQNRTLSEFLGSCMSRIPDVRFADCRGTVVALPDGMAVPPFGVISAGVAVGRLIKGRVEPEHDLFKAYGDSFRRILELAPEDARVARYLHGEEIDADGLEDGWAVVRVAGCTLGGIKVVRGRAKNHYPKGLRIP